VPRVNMREVIRRGLKEARGNLRKTTIRSRSGTTASQGPGGGAADPMAPQSIESHDALVVDDRRDFLRAIASKPLQNRPLRRVGTVGPLYN
jgi:hypothetical protein